MNRITAAQARSNTVFTSDHVPTSRLEFIYAWIINSYNNEVFCRPTDGDIDIKAALKLDGFFIREIVVFNAEVWCVGWNH